MLTKITLTTLTILLLIGCANSLFKDSYKEVVIEKQAWMEKNLDVNKFRNGDAIALVNTEENWGKAIHDKKPAMCYYNFDIANADKYGALYNWYAVNDSRGLAPEGWRIPTDKDWENLISNLEGEKFAGPKLKSTVGWSRNGNGNNESGFNAYPSGLIDGHKNNSDSYVYTETPLVIFKTPVKSSLFSKEKTCASFWSSTETYPKVVYNVTLYYFDYLKISNAKYDSSGIVDDTYYGRSVRCIKNY